MNWETIIVSVLGLTVFGDILLRVLFKSDRRIADSKADIAEAEAIKAKDAAHAEQCRQYEERIKDLHGSIDKLNEQLDHYIERDAQKEDRFNNQTSFLRDKQRELLESTQRETEYVKRIGELELELEKKRCDDLPCAWRLPPNAHTNPIKGQNKEEYLKNRRKS